MSAKIPRLAKVGILVTSYEKNTPIITHIFWGESLKEAVGYAKSHCVTDFFFSSTFAGYMQWKDGELILSKDYHTIGIRKLKDADAEDLEDHALQIHQKQIYYGLEDIFAEILSSK